MEGVLNVWPITSRFRTSQLHVRLVYRTFVVMEEEDYISIKATGERISSHRKFMNVSILMLVMEAMWRQILILLLVLRVIQVSCVMSVLMWMEKILQEEEETNAQDVQTPFSMPLD